MPDNIQWIDDQSAVIDEVSNLLDNGGTFAAQVPIKDQSMFYSALEILLNGKWKRLNSVRNWNNIGGESYYNLLIKHFSKVSIFRTDYYHIIDSKDMVIEWYKGSGLRPYLSVLSKEEQAEFIIDLKALEHILKKMTIVIRDEELIVGNLTTAPRSTSIFPEFSNKWLLDEFSTLEQRTGDPFAIDAADQKALEESIPYWDGKTVNELATELMFEDAKTAMNHNVFTVGNYYFNGVGHIGVDYEKVLKMGFSGIIAEAQEALKCLDKTLPEAVEKGHFLEAVIISCSAAVDFAHRFADLANEIPNTLNTRFVLRGMPVILVCSGDYSDRIKRTFHITSTL